MHRATRCLAVASALALLVVGLAAPAGAAPSCSYDAPTLSVTVSVGNGETATIGRAGVAITLDGAPCDVATVTTTDTIVVNSTGTPQEIAIDLSGGGFEPGATAEAEGSSEIEFTLDIPAGTPTLRIVGGSGSDNIVVGTGGINLNATESPGDADVLITGNPSIVLSGGDGNDMLSVGGGAGTGPAGPGATVLGGAGGDLLLGGMGGSAFDGGAGTDEVDYSAATGVMVHLGNGVAVGEGTDTLVSIENVLGSPGNDRIVGDAGPNVLDGAGGGDIVIGAGGDDTLIGGAGRDAAFYRSSPRGVHVNLGKGTARGAGADTLTGIEDVDGSRFADVIHGDGSNNRLDGWTGLDRIYGHGGDDLILGGDGSDLLFGQRGNDLLRGQNGKDQLDGGPGDDICKGGDDPDSYVFCENFPTVKLPGGVWFREAA